MKTSEHQKTDIASYLTFGMKLTGSIEFAIDDKREVTCSFIGLKRNQYLLFELSLKSVDEVFMRRTNGTSIVVRGFSDVGEGHVVAFRSKVLKLLSTGVPLLFVQFPNKVESKPVRAYKRYKVDFKASIYIDNKMYPATLIDISKAGCAVLIENEQIEIEKGAEVFIEPEIQYIEKPYPKCFVVNKRMQNGNTILGIDLEHELNVSDNLKLEVLQNAIV